MTDKRLFVVVPSFRPSGPNKGASALCNGLVNYMEVTLVVLKPETGKEFLMIDPRVKIFSLEKLSWKNKYATLRKALLQAGGRKRVTLLSLSFHADALNFFMAPYANIVSSVRGNLMRIYWYEYGVKGFVSALLQLILLRRFDHVIAMSQAMADQLRRYGLRRVSIIRNFIDELNLEKFRKMHQIHEKEVRFIFLGSLSVRKRPELLLDAIRELHDMGIVCRLDLVGDGQLREKLISKTKALNLEKWVAFYGHKEFPYDLLQKSDFMVLPSESEGIPRAVLEALFFGVPCILRDVDGHGEVIQSGINGELFEDDHLLVEAMGRAVRFLRNGEKQEEAKLLSDSFRQKKNIQLYLKLLDQMTN